MSRITFATTGLVLGLAIHGSALGSGITIDDQSPRASAMQGAFTAVADDPATIFYNPAGLTQLEGTQIDVNSSILSPDITYERPGLGSAANDGLINSASIFVTSDALEGASIGLGLYVPFGRATKFENSTALVGLSHRASLIRADVVPTVAFKLHPRVSVGLGVVASHVILHTKLLGLDESGRGYGFTANAGLLIDAPQHVKVGFTYRGAMSARLEGHGAFSGIRDDFHAKLRFPAILSSGIAWTPNERWQLAAAWDWEMWSYLQTFRRDYTNPTLRAVGTNTFQGRDVGTLRFGLTYRPTADHELRFGYSRSPSAFPARNTAPAQPDLDTQWFSIGYARNLDKMTLSMSYQFVHSQDQTTQSPFFPGRYQLRANILQFGFSYRFDD